MPAPIADRNAFQCRDLMTDAFNTIADLERVGSRRDADQQHESKS
jgi:hypothetical protein